MICLDCGNRDIRYDEKRNHIIVITADHGILDQLLILSEKEIE